MKDGYCIVFGAGFGWLAPELVRLSELAVAAGCEARIAIQMIDNIVDEASPQEIQEGVLTLKEMETGKQERLSPAELIRRLS